MSWSSAPKKAHADLAAASAPGCAHPDAASTSTPGLAPAEAKPAAARVERRRGIRYRCEGSAAFRAEGSDVRIWGSLSDISQDGCYIEMTATFPVATIANLVLEANGIRLRLKGRVQVNYPFLGMGMRFSEVSEEPTAGIAGFALQASRTPSRRVAGLGRYPSRKATNGNFDACNRRPLRGLECHSEVFSNRTIADPRRVPRPNMHKP